MVSLSNLAPRFKACLGQSELLARRRCNQRLWRKPKLMHRLLPLQTGTRDTARLISKLWILISPQRALMFQADTLSELRVYHSRICVKEFDQVLDGLNRIRILKLEGWTHRHDSITKQSRNVKLKLSNLRRCSGAQQVWVQIQSRLARIQVQTISVHVQPDGTVDFLHLFRHHIHF